MRNSSYNFMQILLKLNRCFFHGLKMSMWFPYNPQIVIYHFFYDVNLDIYSAFNAIDVLLSLYKGSTL